MPVFDANLMFHTTAAVTVSQSNGPLTVRGTPIEGLAGRVVVPANTTVGADDTILPKYYGSDDNSTYYLIAQYQGGATKLGNAGGELITPIVTNYKYIKEELVIVATTPNFGVVISGLVKNVGGNWSRAVDWS